MQKSHQMMKPASLREGLATINTECNQGERTSFCPNTFHMAGKSIWLAWPASSPALSSPTAGLHTGLKQILLFVLIQGPVQPGSGS